MEAFNSQDIFYGVFASQHLGGNLVEREEYKLLSQESCIWTPFFLASTECAILDKLL